MKRVFIFILLVVQMNLYASNNQDFLLLRQQKPPVFFHSAQMVKDKRICNIIIDRLLLAKNSNLIRLKLLQAAIARDDAAYINREFASAEIINIILPFLSLPIFHFAILNRSVDCVELLASVAAKNNDIRSYLTPSGCLVNKNVIILPKPVKSIMPGFIPGKIYTYIDAFNLQALRAETIDEKIRSDIMRAALVKNNLLPH